MPEVLEKLKNNQKENREPSLLEMSNRIQVELMRRSQMDSVKWIEKYSEEFRDLLDSNQELFKEIYQRDPGELYFLLELALGRKN